MFQAKVFQDFVGLYDDAEELVYWSDDEWREDPDLVPAIVNAVVIGYTQGAEAVRALLEKGTPMTEPNVTFAEMLAQLSRDPDAVATITVERLIVGAALRRRTRAALDAARVNGAAVEVYESKGLLDSTFALRMEGTGRQLLGPVRELAVLADRG